MRRTRPPRYRERMLFTRKKTELPSPEDALDGRDRPIVPSRPHLVLGTPLTPPFPEGTERAIVGMGCFWGAERLFWQLPGVHTTAVGYAGGITPNPTYEETCTGRTGHAEVVLAVYHPEQISYEELLKVFWEEHDPTQGMRQGNDVGTTYRSAIYWTTDEQRLVAWRRATAMRRRSPPPTATRSRPSSPRPGRSTTPRTTTSSTWQRTRTGTAGSPARVSLARSARVPR